MGKIFNFYAPRKVSGEHIVVALSVLPSSSVRPILVRPFTWLFEVGFWNNFTEMTTMLRRRVARNIWVPTLKVKVTARPCSKFVSGPWHCYLKSDFENISQKWSPYLDDVSHATFGSLPWRSRLQHYLAAKSCPAHNFVIRSRILKIFHRNDHHIELTCGASHLGRYLEGQSHSMNLQQKSCLAQSFVIWSLILQLLLTNYFSVSYTYSGSITRFRPALVLSLLCSRESWELS